MPAPIVWIVDGVKTFCKPCKIGGVALSELEVARNMTVQLPPSFLDASSAERVLNKKSALVLLEIGAKSGVGQ